MAYGGWGTEAGTASAGEVGLQQGGAAAGGTSYPLLKNDGPLGISGACDGAARSMFISPSAQGFMCLGLNIDSSSARARGEAGSPALPRRRGACGWWNPVPWGRAGCALAPRRLCVRGHAELLPQGAGAWVYGGVRRRRGCRRGLPRGQSVSGHRREGEAGVRLGCAESPLKICGWVSYWVLFLSPPLSPWSSVVALN